MLANVVSDGTVVQMPLKDWTAVTRRLDQLEEALAEIYNASYPLSKGLNGKATTICVPIGAWDNAMRVIDETQSN